MPSPTDWGRGGQPGFLRDPGNEQTTPLAAGAPFVGQWTRVDKAKSFAVLYGTHVPFTMQIQWSADGVTQDSDPFATITPQVRNRLGLHSVISFQSTFFRPFYRIKVTNGPTAQLFVISDALLMDSIFPGYLIDVDGPIPVLGLAALNHGLAWGRGPNGWVPLAVDVDGHQIMELSAAALAAIEGVTATLDPASLAALEQTTVTIDAASLAALENITAALDAATLAALAATTVGTPTRLTLATTTLVKTGAGVLERVIVNKISAAGAVTLTLYNALTADPTKIIAAVVVGATSPGASGITAPASLDYFAAFTTGLTAVLSAVGSDVTLVWR